MNITITPAYLSGTIQCIASKSYALRYLILSALADRKTDIFIRGISDDIAAAAGCLCALGCKIEESAGKLTVHPLDMSALPSDVTLECSSSAAVFRFMTAMCAALGIKATLTCSSQLARRPHDALFSALREGGASIIQSGNETRITGKISTNQLTLDCSLSSQYLSACLMMLALGGDTSIKVSGCAALSGYADITLDAMNAFGVHCALVNGKYSAMHKGYTSPGKLHVPGDWSSAAVWLTAGALGGDITIAGLSRDLQPDFRIIALLSRMNADVSYENPVTGEARAKKSKMKGIELDCGGTPDIVPAAAAAAALSDGTTVIKGISRLRYKESDRTEATLDMLKSLGAFAKAGDGKLIITGQRRLRGGRVDSHGDHRIVMAAAALSCVCENEVVICGAEAVAKSYPGFFDDFVSLGGKIQMN